MEDNLQKTTELSKKQIAQPCILAELAERSLITIQNRSHPSSQKNLVVRPYDRTYGALLGSNLENKLCYGV